MTDYTSMSNAIRSVLYKKEKSITLAPEMPDTVSITGPDPVDVVSDEPIDPLHPRMYPTRRSFTRGDDPVKHHLVRNIRTQLKLKILDND